MSGQLCPEATLSEATLSKIQKTPILKDAIFSGEGHCPEEDSLASLELALLKIQKGNEFGDLRYHQEEGFDEIIKLRNEWYRENKRQIPITVNSKRRAKKSGDNSPDTTSNERESCEGADVDKSTAETNDKTEAEANDEGGPPRVIGSLTGKDVPAETLTRLFFFGVIIIMYFDESSLYIALQ